jgi:hypothetical protein
MTYYFVVVLSFLTLATKAIKWNDTGAGSIIIEEAFSLPQLSQLLPSGYVFLGIVLEVRTQNTWVFSGIYIVGFAKHANEYHGRGNPPPGKFCSNSDDQV